MTKSSADITLMPSKRDRFNGAGLDWNGIIGSVASVVNSALPLFFGAFAKQTDAILTAPIGPATLYTDGGTFKIGNFDNQDSGTPVLLNFSSPPGKGGEESATNLAIQLSFAQSFDAEPWLKQYTDGDVTVGVTEAPASAISAGALEGLWTFVTQALLSANKTITAVVNPSLTLQLKFDVGNNVVAVAVLGTVALLGHTYMITANNNSGKSGTRSGNLNPQSQDASGDNANFNIELPSGIDFSDGIYGLQLQLPVELSNISTASDPRVKFETVPAEMRAKMIRIKAE